MLNTKARVELSRQQDPDNERIEKDFDYSRHNFMARGGEVYYLHILQALQLVENDNRAKLEKLLTNLVEANGHDFSAFANWINDTWIDDQGIDKDNKGYSNNRCRGFCYHVPHK